MKRSPSPRTILAHLLPETSTQSLLLFYLAILKPQPRPTKTSRQGWRPPQRHWRLWPSFLEDADHGVFLVLCILDLRGCRPRFNLHLFRSLLSPFLLDNVRGDHHHSNPNISQPTHTHTHTDRGDTRSEQGGSSSKQGNNPKHHSTHNRTHLNITRLEYHTPKTSSTEPKIPNFIKHHKIIEDPHKNRRNQPKVGP
jgi:hypothetical protein